MKHMFLLLIIFTLSGCAIMVDGLLAQSLGYHMPYYDGAPFAPFPEKIFFILEIKDCKFKERIAPTSHMWRPGAANLVQLEVKRLQSIATVRGANSISNVVIKDANNPIGEADAYLCPEEIYLKNAENQKSKEFFDKVVKVVD